MPQKFLKFFDFENACRNKFQKETGDCADERRLVESEDLPIKPGEFTILQPKGGTPRAVIYCTVKIS
jgi:hypothetical protein